MGNRNKSGGFGTIEATSMLCVLLPVGFIAAAVFSYIDDCSRIASAIDGVAYDQEIRPVVIGSAGLQYDKGSLAAAVSRLGGELLAKAASEGSCGVSEANCLVVAGYDLVEVSEETGLASGKLIRGMQKTYGGLGIGGKEIEKAKEATGLRSLFERGRPLGVPIGLASGDKGANLRFLDMTPVLWFSVFLKPSNSAFRDVLTKAGVLKSEIISDGKYILLRGELE